MKKHLCLPRVREVMKETEGSLEDGEVVVPDFDLL
jgi:hypothetical protein